MNCFVRDNGVINLVAVGKVLEKSRSILRCSCNEFCLYVILKWVDDVTVCMPI